MWTEKEIRISMTNGGKGHLKQIDIAILGGGPAGLQAALVLSRTRKKIIVFDDPEPPRNAASHGVHNFLGLDGLLPTDIRRISWNQIEKYDSAELRKEKIVNVIKEDGIFVIIADNQTSIRAKKVVLAVGYHDVYPDIPRYAQAPEPIYLGKTEFRMIGMPPGRQIWPPWVCPLSIRLKSTCAASS